MDELEADGAEDGEAARPTDFGNVIFKGAQGSRPVALSCFKFDYDVELDRYAGVCKGFNLIESLRAFVETNRDEFEFDITSGLLVRFLACQTMHSLWNADLDSTDTLLPLN